MSAGPGTPHGSEPLRDSFGRVATDLRLSVTDRCDFRCTYCMPAEGLPQLPRSEILTFDEIARLTGICLGLGISTVRITGGEPLVRRGIEDLVGMLGGMAIPDLSMTTNGFLLADKAEALARAGLRRVNVSVDSLHRDRFERITRRNVLDQVLDGIKAAERAGLTPIKLNCVVLRGVNDDEAVDFARLARETGCEMRFIEYMPLDAAGVWTREQVVPGREILAAIEQVFPLSPAADQAGPARVYGFADGAPGSIGVIASVTEPFCADCDRMRITADGQFRSCLFAVEETDLRGLLRGGASDETIAAAIRAAVARKPAGHTIGEESFVRPARPMSLIGG